VYCPGLEERCVDVGEVSGYHVQHYIWLAVSPSLPTVGAPVRLYSVPSVHWLPGTFSWV
jgi:hypothetical protein